MTLPYLPSGVGFLPANRFLLFADGSHLIHRLDESKKTLNGVSFTGWWETPTLNKETLLEETLILLTMLYTSPVNTTLTVKASGDGGETWPESYTVNVVQTTEDRVQRVRQKFSTSGFDIRVRLELDTDEVLNIYELHSRLVVRSEHVIR